MRHPPSLTGSYKLAYKTRQNKTNHLQYLVFVYHEPVNVPLMHANIRFLKQEKEIPQRSTCTTIFTSLSLSKCWFMACFVLHAMLCDALRRNDQAIKDPVKCHCRWMNLVIIHMDISALFSTIVCSSSDQESSLADWLLVFLLVPRHHRLVLW